MKMNKKYIVNHYKFIRDSYTIVKKLEMTTYTRILLNVKQASINHHMIEQS